MMSSFLRSGFCLMAALLPFLMPAAAVYLAAIPDAVAQRRTISLTARQLTQQAVARFPQRRCLLALACVTLSDPVVRLKDGDPRIFLAARITPEMGAQVLAGGSLEVAGKPRYDPARGAFFFDAPEILRLDYPDLSPAYLAQATDLTRSLLVDYLRQTPVWVLDEQDSQQALAKLVLRQVEVRGGALRFTIGDDE